MTNLSVSSRLVLAGLCIALLGTAGCRCGTKTPAPAARARADTGAVGLAAPATATQLPAPATVVAAPPVDAPMMLGDAEQVLRRASAWLAPRFCAGLEPGRHGLARTLASGLQHEIIDVTTDGMDVQWSGFGVRFERKGRDCRTHSGEAEAGCPRAVVEQTSLLLALTAVCRPQTWQEGAWRFEALRTQSDDSAHVRLASPRYGVRFEVSVQRSGAVSAIAWKDHCEFSEDGHALNTGESGMWRWESPVQAQVAEDFFALRVPVNGSLDANAERVVGVVAASKLPVSPSFIELEFETTERGTAWRAFRMPLDQARLAGNKLPPDVLAVHPQPTEASGFVPASHANGLAQVQALVDTLKLARGCHIVRMVAAQGAWSSGEPIPYLVHACPPQAPR